MMISTDVSLAQGFGVWMLTIHGRHDEADLSGISRTGEMGVDLLCLVLVETDKSVEDVVASQGVVFTTLVVREVVLHRASGELLLEAIDLVQEQDDRGTDEPAGIADGVEQGEGLLHAVDGLVLEQELIVLGDSNEEEDGGNVLEAVDPLLTLRSLSADVEHAVGQVTDDEGGLGDTSCLYTRAQDVLVIWHVVVHSDTLDVVEIARRLLAGSGEARVSYYRAESFS